MLPGKERTGQKVQGAYVHAYVRVHVRVPVCVHACVRAHVCTSVRACACVAP